VEFGDRFSIDGGYCLSGRFTSLSSGSIVYVFSVFGGGQVGLRS